MSQGTEEAVRFDNVWEDAYSRLNTEEPELLQAYEDGILEDTRSKCKDSRAKLLQERASSINKLKQQLEVVLEVQSEYIDEHQWIIHLGNKDVKVRDAVKKTVNAVTAAKDFISSAASHEPHAALAWAGISCLLPLILNASTQEDDAIEGLDYVQDLLSRYRVVQLILMENKRLAKAGFDDIDARKKMRVAVINLYFLTIKYQFALVKQYARNKFVQVLRNMAARDDWKKKLEDVKTTERKCEDHRKVLETEAQIMTSNAVYEQSSKLDQLLKLSEDEKVLREQAELDKWLKDMFPRDMDSAHTTFKNQFRYKGSGEWFVKQIRTWLLEGDEMILWRRGIPGVGKSMLMSIAIDDISQDADDYGFEGTAYLYLQWDKQLQQTPTAVFASILHKLHRSSKSLTRAVEALKQAPAAPSSAELAMTLTKHGRRPDLKGDGAVWRQTNARFLVFLDGLDEATPDTRKALTTCLDSLDPRFFRIVITSRQDLSVTTNHILTKELEITADPIDLALYIRAQLISIQEDINPTIWTSHSRLLEDLVVDIRDRAHGMFLHAKHHTNFVGNLSSASEMRDAAKRPFANLNQIYDEILKHMRLDEQVQEVAMRTLAWLTFAKRPMDGATLVEALAIRPDDTAMDYDRVPHIEAIVRQCRGLVTFDKESGTSRLAHQTIQEYLRSLHSIIAYQSVIVTTCFTRLAMDTTSRKKTEPRREDRLSSDYSKAEIAALPRAGTNDFLANLSLAESRRSSDEDDESIDTASGSSDDLNSDDLNSEDGEDKYPQFFMERDGLHKWANQSTSFGVYSGTFAISHLRSLQQIPDDVIASMWKFLARRPKAGLLRLLTTGRNKYPQRYTPLHVAVLLGHVPTIARLHQEGIAIDVKGALKRTPLMCAARYADAQVIHELLRLGADASACDSMNLTSIELLQFDVDESMARDLMPTGHTFRRNVIALAAYKGFREVVKVLLEAGIGDPNFRTEIDRRTALSYACKHGYLSTVEVLLLHKADPKATDPDGSTPLHDAVESGKAEIVRLLLQHGADPNAVDNRNEHALLRVARGGSDPERHLPQSTALEILEALLESRPDLDIKSNSTGTALWQAAVAANYPRIARRLVKAGCDIHKEHLGYTPFQKLALSDPDSKSYQVLQKAEQDFGKKNGLPWGAAFRNSEGNTLLHLAAASPDDRAVRKLLLDSSVEVDARNLAGRTPLFMAMHPRGEKAVRRLLDGGAKTDVIDYKDNSILDAAIAAAPRDVIAMILDRPCSIQALWDEDEDFLEIEQFADEPWYHQLRACVNWRDITAAREDEFDYDSHIHGNGHSLYGPILGWQYEKDVLEIQIPPDAGFTVQKVRFSMRSRDQGRARGLLDPYEYRPVLTTPGYYDWQTNITADRGEYEDELEDTYVCPFSWFEAGIRRPGKTEVEDIEHLRTIQCNLRASNELRSYAVTWYRRSDDPRDAEWISRLAPGDTIVVLAQCDGADSKNHVLNICIDIFGNSENGQAREGSPAKEEDQTTEHIPGA